SYHSLQSILHRARDLPELDFEALSYVLPRLPTQITTTSSLILTEKLPTVYASVEEAIRLPSRRAQKRRFYGISSGRMLAVLRDSMSDTVDLISKLSIYAIEMSKIL